MKREQPEQDSPTQKEVDEDEKEYWGQLVSKTKRVNSVKLRTDTFKIGRNAKNNMVINDKKISTHHCLFGREKDSDMQYTYYIQDLSSNGTSLNGDKVT